MPIFSKARKWVRFQFCRESKHLHLFLTKIRISRSKPWAIYRISMLQTHLWIQANTQGRNKKVGDKCLQLRYSCWISQSLSKEEALVWIVSIKSNKGGIIRKKLIFRQLSSKKYLKVWRMLIVWLTY